jgi:hypothetical protein
VQDRGHPFLKNLLTDWRRYKETFFSKKSIIMTGTFSTYQPKYSAMAIPTFPVRPNKIPAVRGWRKSTLKSSERYAKQFSDLDSFGFQCGAPSGKVVLDIDSTSENLLADLQGRFGESKLVVKTASNKYHAIYEWNGERRRIRPWDEIPADLCGDGGFVVAAPSLLPDKGAYSIIVGHLDDLGGTLTKMTGLDPDSYVRRPLAQTVAPSACEHASPPEMGNRNNELFRHMMRFANNADDLESMMKEAARYNDSLSTPLPASEIAAVAQNAWWYETQGLNRMGRRGAYFSTTAIDEMPGPDVAWLLMWLRGHNAPEDSFWVADGLAEKLKMGWRRFAAARKEAIESGWLVVVRNRAPGRPVMYRWGPAARRRAREERRTGSVS